MSKRSLKTEEPTILNHEIKIPALSSIVDMLPRKEYIIYPTNIVLINEKEKPNYVFFIIEGAIALSFTDENGKKRLFDIIGPGDIIGLSGCLLNKESIYKAKTIKTTSCIAIHKDMFGYMLENNKEFTAKMMGIVSSEAEKKEKKIYNLQHLNIEERLIQTVMRLRRIFGLDRAGYILYQFKDEMLNALLNTNTYDLYEAFEKLQDKNLLSYNRGMIEILDIASLKDEVERRGSNLF